jgi:hypothetical protein
MAPMTRAMTATTPITMPTIAPVLIIVMATGCSDWELPVELLGLVEFVKPLRLVVLTGAEG